MKASDLEFEADMFSDLLDAHEGGRAAFLAMLQARHGIEIDQQCPRCSELIVVTPFPDGFTQGCSAQCPCGLIKTSLKGL